MALLRREAHSQAPGKPVLFRKDVTEEFWRIAGVRWQTGKWHTQSTGLRIRHALLLCAGNSGPGFAPPARVPPPAACVARSPSNTSGASQRGFVTAVLLRSLGASSSRRLQAGPERVAQLVRVLCNLLTGLVRSWDRAISGRVSHHIASLLQPAAQKQPVLWPKNLQLPVRPKQQRLQPALLWS